MAEKRTENEKEVPSWQVEEAKALSLLFADRASLSQGEFGAMYEIGSQGMVWQYLNGRRPLNIAAATAFANGLGVLIPEFSPRLAAEIERAYAKVRGENDGEVSAEARLVIDAIRKADRSGEPASTFKLILRMLPEDGEPIGRLNP